MMCGIIVRPGQHQGELGDQEERGNEEERRPRKRGGPLPRH